MTDNVYKNLNMQVFKDFVDKMSMEELFDKYGKPNAILDAYEVAGEKGFDIYEYTFPEGSIHCYIKQGVDSDRALVDYIYYEPNNNIKQTNFVYSDSLCAIIQKGTSVVYYIGDEFNNFVRFRLNSENRNEIVNVALNDVSQLDVRERISSDVQEMRQHLPLSLGDFGFIDKIALEGKDLQLHIIVDENYDLKLPYIVKQNPEWATILTIFLFNSFGVFKGKTSDIMKEYINIKYSLYGNVSNIQKESVIYTEDFRKLFRNGISNEKRMTNYVSFSNFTLPLQVNEYVTVGKEKIENEILIVPFFMKGTKEEYIGITDKEYNTSTLKDKDNPEREEISLCATQILL